MNTERGLVSNNGNGNAKSLSQKRWYAKWDAAAYIKDTRALTCEQKGVWSDLLNYMIIDDQLGEIVGTSEELARMCGCDVQTFERCLHALIRIGICTKFVPRLSQAVTSPLWGIRNRRMWRESAPRRRQRAYRRRRSLRDQP